MKSALPILVYLVVLVQLALLLVWVSNKFIFKRRSFEEIEADSKRHLDRLLNPDFAALEKEFGCSFPQELKRLYSDKDELKRENFEVRPPGAKNSDAHFIAFYKPADIQSVRDGWEDCKGCFSFATDGCGNEYLVDPKQADPEVFFYDHEGGKRTKVADKLSTFLSWPKNDVTE